MRKQRKRIVIMALLLMLMTTALADATLIARIDGNTLRITWEGCSGVTALKVYQNGWPISVTNASGSSGSANLGLCNPSGTYTVRLMMGQGMLATDISAEAPVKNETPAPTQRPQNKPATQPVAQPSPKPSLATGAANQTGLAAQVVEEVNMEREKRGLYTLRVDPELTRAACVRAAEIVQKFSHTRPDGSKWSTVSTSAYGENIAMGQRTADKVMAAWMSSEGHRANILQASYGSIGVCAYMVNGVTYWVQLFGK